MPPAPGDPSPEPHYIDRLLGSTLARAAITALVRAAEEMRDRGTFSFGEGLMSFREINSMFGA